MQRLQVGRVMVMGMAVLVTACGSTKLMGKTLPDETQVIDGPTLALPPQFELRPPRESSDYESLLRAQKSAEAQNLIVNGTSATTAGMAPATGGEVPATDAWLLNKTKAQTGVVADPNVRAELDAAGKSPEEQQAKAEAAKKQGLLKRWFGGSDDE